MTLKRGLGVLGVFLLIAAFGAMLVVSVRDGRPAVEAGEIVRIDKVLCRTGEWEKEITLPLILQTATPRSPVSLLAEIEPGARDSLLVKLVFAPARVYVDGVLLLEYGEAGSYPRFLNDPPTGLALVALPDAEGPVQLRIDYMSPTQRSSLSLPALHVGSERALIEHLFRENGFILLFSLVLLFLGAAVVIASTAFVRRNLSGSPFLWLGLFALSAGAWVLGECDLSAFLLPYPSLFYVLDYLGLFCLAIPALRFGLIILGPRNRQPLNLLLWVHRISVAGAVLLQMLGLVDLMRSLYWFHIITPLAFVVFACILLWEHVRYRNRAVLRFVPAAVMLTLAALLELINYWAGMIRAFTVLFQMGLLAVIVWLGVVSGLYVRESARTASEKIRLEYELDAMSRQLEQQRWQYERMMQDAQTLRAMRHDMRHHTAALGRLAAAGNREELQQYLTDLEDRLTTAREVTYCKNYAVNAVAAHYLHLAEEEGVTVTVRLEVPEETGCVPALDLCVVLGNFLENALEGCRRVPPGERFLHAHTRIDGDTLSIVVTNSFDGIWREENGSYYSRKAGEQDPHRIGVGLSSAEAVCARHRGMMRVEIGDRTWKSLALVHMEET